MTAARFRSFLPVAAAAVSLAAFAVAGPRLRAARRARTRIAREASAAAAAVAGADTRSAALVQFASVALGGFRGLIADALWLRAGRMQEQRRFVELVQLSDWVAQLEPDNEEIWIFHAWNMAYNVSFLLSRPDDRWRWVGNGVALLRDRGIPLNPRSAALKEELGWLFQHKIGMDADEAAPFYRTAWAREIGDYLGEDGSAPEPGSFAEEELATQMRMDAALMRDLAARFGPVDWRVPAASSFYWGWLGAEESDGGPAVSACRRMVYQSLMEMARGAGRLAGDPDDPDWTFAAGPVPALAPATLAYVRSCMAESGFSGTRYAYVFFLRDMILLSLFAPGGAPAAERYRSELASFFDAFGLGGEIPPLGGFPEAPPDLFESLLLRAGFR